MIVRLVMPVGYPDAARIEMERAPEVTDELDVGMPAGIDHLLLRLQISSYFLIRRLRDDDVIKRLRRPVIAEQDTFPLHGNLNRRLECPYESQITCTEPGQLPFAHGI